jgi:hypothetical protein
MTISGDKESKTGRFLAVSIVSMPTFLLLFFLAIHFFCPHVTEM